MYCVHDISLCGQSYLSFTARKNADHLNKNELPFCVIILCKIMGTQVE